MASSNSISILTASVPERAALLEECKASVAAQTVAPLEHLIEIDHDHRGQVPTTNSLLEKAQGEWWVWLNDDDLLYPTFLSELLAKCEGADVVYPYAKLGELDWSYHMGEFDAKRLRQGNYIPCTALIRTSLTRDLGGIRESPHCEDWDLWLRMLAAGGRFICVPKVLWQYRFQVEEGHRNKSLA